MNRNPSAIILHYSTALDLKLKKKILGKNQNGFRRNRCTTSQILSFHRIFESVGVKYFEVIVLFVDLSKPFDSIHGGKMDQIFPAYDRPKQTLTTIMMIYKNESKSLLAGWTHMRLWHHRRCVARRHIGPIPVYHLPRIAASNVDRFNERKWLYFGTGKKRMRARTNYYGSGLC